MIKKILVIVVLAVLGLLGFAATKPDSFEVKRSVTINAEPETVFGYLDDFVVWDRWSPWAKKDPAMQKSTSGSERGVGAIYEWNGNKEVGQGRMEIVESNPASDLRIKLDFLAPFEAHNIADFSIAKDQQGSQLSWTLSGPNPFMAKFMSIFVSMDEMVGNDFEQGLANLKQLVESEHPDSG